MALNWFDASAEKNLGFSLAQFFAEKLPAAALDANSAFPFQENDDTLGVMAAQLDQFKLEHKLNIYKKAQFGNVFKWALKEAGYQRAHIDQLTNWLLLRL